ncbi:MAG: CRISPR-associated endonuclease Cas1 [Polyangiaceae bacterium]|nr:CRISPR-associated endonuclease Cas1 [Polyangiaceae bacterium]
MAGTDPVARLLLLHFALGRGAAFRFFHAPTVYAFLHARLETSPDDALPRGVRLHAVESARIHYVPGDGYHLGIALLPDAALTVRDLIERLARRCGAPRLEGVPLGARTRLVQVTDLVSGADITRRGEAEPLTVAMVEQAAGPLAQALTATLCFDSPLLVLRRPVQQRDTFFDGDVCDPSVLLERVARAAANGWPAFAPAAAVPAVSLRANRLVRGETYYRGAGPRHETVGKILPGAVGHVAVDFEQPIGEPWAIRLLLGGLYGAGKSTAMGQGRFHVQGAPIHPRWPPPAAATLCERMARDEILARARVALAGAGSCPGVDEVEKGEFLEALTYRLPFLRDAVALGEHRPNALRGLLLERKNGAVRPLAIPTLEDRFLQRAAVEELAPAFDELFEETSFAYRRGLSRRNAEQRVRQAHDEGYVHVLDADVRSFFDRVDWGLLRQRLSAYLGRDPAVDLLMRWVQAPVEFGGRLIERQQGLPQGAVISPLLANLYLDCFDEAIEREGFRLVRYADDFVVLCKSADDARRAREVVERELERLRLELAGEKTAVTSFDHGFDFLGYVFARSISIQKQKPSSEVRVVASPDELADARALDPTAARGWLSDWLGQPAEAEEPEAPRFQAALAPSSPARRSVYVVEPGLRLTGSRRGLRVYGGETLLDEVAWSTLSEIAVLGQRPVGSSLFQQAMRHRVPVSMYTRAGKPLGVVLPDRVRTPSPTTRDHWRWSDDHEARLRVARALVEAKIHNQRLVARHQPGDTGALRERLELLAGQATRAERVERVRGLEGAAAHAYFAAWSEWLPPELGFTRRSGRGAQDPVNALLNLVYTQLFHRCWLACIAEGLDPYLGVLHESQDRFAALAADLQEPFRFLCDRLVLDLFHRRRLTRADFVRQEKPEPVTRLKPAGLKLVLGEWERRLEARVKSSGATRSYRGHIAAQAGRFAEVVRGERQEMSPFRLKW